MLARMSTEDFLRWKAFFSNEPFWWERLEWMIAQMTSVLHNRLPGPPRPATKASQFMYHWPVPEGGDAPKRFMTANEARAALPYRPPPPEQDPREVHAIMKRIFG